MLHFTPPAAVALRAFIEAHSEALQNASFVLGGMPALNRAQRLIDDLRTSQVVTRRLEFELVALHKLLTLQYLDDPDSIEAACFAELDPSSPIVEDICLLTDQYTDALRDFDEGRPSPMFVDLLAA